jgi:3-deoxy-manno-octulosonate cytidylyltransferase (CMP-KDO synthetase)
MIERVHERARRSLCVERVLVATDDERIASCVRAFGGEVVLTSTRHQSGTDRLAEVATTLGEADVIVNVQGDEPMLDPDGIDVAVAALLADPDLPLATLATPIRDAQELTNPAVVKVVTNARSEALYFSRLPIPYVRPAGDETGSPAVQAVARSLARRHIGLYVYRRPALLRLAALPPAPLELAEGLEQLRALHHGLRIGVVDREHDTGIAIDTPEDLARVRALLAGEARPEPGGRPGEPSHGKD